MIGEVNQTVSYVLSDAKKAYAKFKELILKIFSLIGGEKKINLKDEFYESYIDFARYLDEISCHDESKSFMAICEMYYDLMDRPEVLKKYECFFMDLFNSFEEILNVKINNPQRYNVEYPKFLRYRRKMQEYYYCNLAVPSPHFNKDTLDEITRRLSSFC